jgi:hypothetical protein
MDLFSKIFQETLLKNKTPQILWTEKAKWRSLEQKNH